VPFAEANGQRLHYDVHGEGEPLLLVMGLGTDSLAWFRQVPVFSRSFRTIVFDNRDVGQSTYCDEDYEIADMAEDALALADHLGLDSFHLVGMSLGGAIAQGMAIRAGERVRTLTLAVTYAFGGVWGRAQVKAWADWTLKASREERADELLLLTLTDDFFESPERVARAREMILSNPHPQPPEAFVRQLHAARAHDARDRLGELGMPVHVIGAGRDILVPSWKSKELAELIPGARLSIVERAAHGLNLEFAPEFNRLVLEFVQERAGDREPTPG
jgi:3-oxoadipate enol-lactonase